MRHPMPKTPTDGHIVICADDYGAEAAGDGVILALLGQGALDATTCLVGAPDWGRSAPALRELAAGGDIAVGLHLNLTQTWSQGEGGSPFAPIRAHVARALFPVDAKLESAMLGAFERQWEAFGEAMGRAPDFMDGHEHVHLFPAARGALWGLCARMHFSGWVRQCRTSSRRRSAKRLVLDPFSDAFARAAARRNIRFNSGFGGLRRFDPAEDIGAIWREDLAAMTGGGVLMVHPGAPSGGRAGECRAQEAALLTSGWMARTLGELGRASLD